MQICLHSSRRFVSNLDRGFKDALRNNVSVTGGCRFGGYKNTVILMTSNAVCLDLLFQSAKPFGNKMNVLYKNYKETK